MGTSSRVPRCRAAPWWRTRVALRGAVLLGLVLSAGLGLARRGRSADPAEDPGARCAVAGDDLPALVEIALHVDPVAGADVPDRDGSPGRPFRTIGHALARASTIAAEDGGRRVRASILLEPGLYGADGSGAPCPGASGDGFPASIPPALAALRLAPAGGAAAPGDAGDCSLAPVLWSSSRGAILDADRSGTSEAFRLEVDGLAFRGGASGVRIVAAAGDLVATFRDCSFESQTGAAISVRAAGRGLACVSVEGSTVRDACGGVILEAAPEAQASLVVERCRIEDLRTWGPEGALGAGVDVHADPLSWVGARVERNVLRAMGTAVRLTSAEADPTLVGSASILDAKIVGNLVDGRPSGPGGAEAEPVLRAGVALSLWPHSDQRILIASNTFVDLAGPVLVHDNLALLGLDAPCEDAGARQAIPWTFVNNIASGIRAESEFDAERPGGCFPPPGVAIRRNILERSRADFGGENLRADPRFVDPDGDDYRLRDDSPALDRADPEFSGLTDVDLAGRCRRAASSCELGSPTYPMDIGAHERGDFCDRDAAVFRRGDCDADRYRKIEISDPVFTFAYLFLGGAEPRILDACDANDDGNLDIADGVYVLSYLFLGGAPPAPPFEEPGTDPTRDCLPVTFR